MSVVAVRSVQSAAQHLRAGDLVAYPTETSYGLGADPTTKKAVEKVFSIKGRAKAKPLSLIAASFADAERYVRFSPKALTIAKKYWPGPLTLILPAKSKRTAGRLGSRDGSLAIRVSSGKQATTIAALAGGVITATSANISSGKDSYTERAVVEAFAPLDETIFFLESGTLPRVLPSTIVRVLDTTCTVLRQGSVRILSSLL
ncbi:threonylcarbamoyl-AMP synthase [Candidatus Uhrbacteria bacterium CG10_big_fil_rev_8_21_14_0_10_48_11]|uniref:L-threonylcarbamoyladenylate synthase n=1 Tax=Candidatus Uhrbacteria bacterium CG10_big_fil_rev_8_21_14_0_10_48_11 TaxID=1975037 RepID=A0A2M8LFR4_9BACT|nr:MAG: threonylcarbamoyl-AMP synthase [Candidatus Uhrbacteria bacterium CG10_big_fil_rev_8_21_14_0_10_48_11]